jgi:DNA topoisomerase I
MPKLKDPVKIEQKEYLIFNPEDVKQAVEVKAKQKPSIDRLEKVEKVGKKKKEKKPKEKKIVESKSTKEYTLIITEKPQAAEKIASALSNGDYKKTTNQKKVSYYEFKKNDKKIVVACAVGHLFTVSQNSKQKEYPVFDISWFPNYEIKKKDFTRRYYDTIASLVKKADEIIVATDFDTEGEVIGYNIVRFIAKRFDAKRMKFSSLTAKELEDSYVNVLPTLEWGQVIAGETRHFLDWMYGINLSRALMTAIKKTGRFKIMSIGRVQGPTLNLIVQKEIEINNFKSTPYWQIFITINDGKDKLELKHNRDITKKEELKKFESLKGKTVEVTTTKTKQIIPPPAPFDLTTLQIEAYKHHSITPAHTLEIAQKLYLAGIISYPRTSSQKIPDSVDTKKIIQMLSKNFKETKKITKSKPIEGHKSDPAHPAIIPTGNILKLDGRDEKLYNLIVKRFISCFCDNAELANKKVEVVNDKLIFNTKGMEIIKSGWTEVYPMNLIEKQLKDFNGPVTIENIKTEEKQTMPPKRFSPASIVSELEKRGLGTKSTRANIIETLYSRNYIKDTSIKATELGIRLIETLKKFSPVIIDERLTREIEKDMDHIRDSKKDLKQKEDATIMKAKEVLEKISKDFKKNEDKIGKELVSANESLWEQQKQDNKLEVLCPECKKGNLTIKYTPRFRSYFIACTNYPECRKTFPLPSQSLIKKSEKKCSECGFPILIRIKQGKRPWLFCFNPTCPTRKEGYNKDNNNNQKDENTESEESKESSDNEEE